MRPDGQAIVLDVDPFNERRDAIAAELPNDFSRQVTHHLCPAAKKAELKTNLSVVESCVI